MYRLTPKSSFSPDSPNVSLRPRRCLRLIGASAAALLACHGVAVPVRAQTYASPVVLTADTTYTNSDISALVSFLQGIQTASYGLTFAGTGSFLVKPDGSGRSITDTGGNLNMTGSGTLTLDGGVSDLSNSIVVARQGTIALTDGATLTCGVLFDGYYAGDSAAVTVSGSGTKWTENSYIMYVGYRGTGALTIQNGGKFTTNSTNTILGNSIGSMGTVNVTGKGADFEMNSLEVGRLGTGTLTLANGALMNADPANGAVVIGDGYTGGGNNSLIGSGTATVDGTSTTLNFQSANNQFSTTPGQISGLLTVGYWATGKLSVQNGGTVIATGGLAVGESGVGTVTIDGIGSALVTNLVAEGNVQGGKLVPIPGGGGGSVYVGSLDYSLAGTGLARAGNGTLTISGGALVSSQPAFIGADTGLNNVASVGVATVTGAGSTWNIATNGAGICLEVGNSGDGTVNILNGGVINAGGVFDAVLSYYSEGYSYGKILVDGTGSQLNSSEGISIGEVGTGTLTVQNHAVVTSVGTVLAGFGPSIGTGTITIQSGGALNVTGDVQSGGGSFYPFVGSDAYSSAVSGLITVDGANSLLTATGYIAVGDNGLGSMTVQNGGTASAGGNLYVAYLYPNQNPGSEALTLQSGGHLSAMNGFIGVSSDQLGVANGTVIVDGASSLLSLSAQLSVGYGGIGSLTVQNGGATQVSGSAYIGDLAGSTGTATITGAGSRLNVTDDLNVGANSVGSLTLQNGGTSNSANVYLGAAVGASGTVTVDGAGSLLTTTADLNVGYSGTGTLTVQNGGAVSTGGSADIGSDYDNGGSSRATVTGAGSKWTIANTLYVGDGGPSSTLTVANGGKVTVAGETYLGQHAGTATTLIVNGGNLTTAGLQLADGGNASIQLTNPTGGYALTLGSDNATTTLAIPIADAAGGPGGIDKVGTGTLTLSGANTFTGASAVDGGTLRLSGGTYAGTFAVASGATLRTTNGAKFALPTGSVLNVGSKTNPGGTLNLNNTALALNGGVLINNGTISNGVVNINAGGTAKGSGNYASGYVLNAGGTLQPGNSPGTLSSGASTWNSGGTFLFQIDNATGTAGTDWGKNAITGALTLAASAASPITLSLESLLASDAATDGPLSNWDPTKSYSWTFVTTTTGITNFNAASFFVDTSKFSAPKYGTFAVAKSGNNMALNYTGAATATPEPSAFALILPGTGVGGMRVVVGRRRRKLG